MEERAEERVGLLQTRVRVGLEQPHLVLVVDHEVESEELKHVHSVVWVEEVVGGVNRQLYALLDGAVEVLAVEVDLALGVVLGEVLDVELAEQRLPRAL